LTIDSSRRKIANGTMDAATVRTWMSEIAASIRAEKDHLVQLDAAIGDGDHGTNMNRGFEAVLRALPEDGAEPPGRLLIVAGRTLVSSVGGASGPLWGSALKQAGRTLGDGPSFGPMQLADSLDGALEAIVDLGQASPGDKTMVDALAPANSALRGALQAGDSVAVAVAAAAEAAEVGMRATIPMQARKGRASYLGERSVGHQDPGATSAALVFRALERAVAARS
jgi:dihydroxyacetone kinase-like protein